MDFSLKKRKDAAKDPEARENYSKLISTSSKKARQEEKFWLWPGLTTNNKLSQMCKISDEVIKFIEKTMKTWRVELTARGENLPETKIQRGIFQGDTLSPLLFIISVMPFVHILKKKCTAGYKLTKSQDKTFPNVHRQHQTVFQKWKRIGKSDTRIQNIQSWHRDGIWHRKIRLVRNENRKTTHYTRNGTTKSRKSQNAQRKGNLQIRGDIGSWRHQTRGDERKKKKKWYFKRTSKLLEIKLYSRNLIKGINT